MCTWPWRLLASRWRRPATRKEYPCVGAPRCWCTRAGAHLHDVAVCLGLGADAVAPWLMQHKAQAAKGALGLQNLLEGLKKGLEKVISTMGIHEVRGYGRIFSAIGLKPELAEQFGIRNFLGSERAAMGCWSSSAPCSSASTC